MNKNRKNKKKYVRPTTAIVIATSGKILAFGSSVEWINAIEEGVEDNAVSYSSRGSAVNSVWDEADSYDGDILMK